MGQVLTFPTHKAITTHASKRMGTNGVVRANNVVIFEGVFVEYHDKPVVHRRARQKEIVPDKRLNPCQKRR